MSNLVEFLTARLAEDEQMARSMNLGGTGFTLSVAGGPTVYTVERALADVAAKRRIVEGYQYLTADPDLQQYAWTFALRALAMSYADHDDYDPDWALE